MKLSFILLASFFSLSLMATDAMVSQNLAGKYELIEASTDYARQYHCAEQIQITVTSERVVLHGIESGVYAGFWSKNEGCTYKEGDIGPIQTRCTTFTESSVSSSDSQPISMIGFVRESEEINLSFWNSDILFYSKNITQVPFGILGIWDKDEFKCKYRRL